MAQTDDAIEVGTATAHRDGDRVFFTITGPGFDITFSMHPRTADHFGQWLMDEAKVSA